MPEPLKKSRTKTKVVLDELGEPRKRCANPDCPFEGELLPLDFFGPNKQVKSNLNGFCKICERERKNLWAVNNPQKHREAGKRWAANPANKLKIKAKGDRWRSKNRERVRKTQREFKRNTAETTKLIEKNKLLADPERHWTRRAVTRCKNRAKKEGIPFDITASDLLPLPEFCSVFSIKLDYFGGADRRIHASVDRIIPALGYVRGNVRIISRGANMAKLDGIGDLTNPHDHS